MKEIYEYGKHITKDKQDYHKFIASVHGHKTDMPEPEIAIKDDDVKSYHDQAIKELQRGKK